MVVPGFSVPEDNQEDIWDQAQDSDEDDQSSKVGMKQLECRELNFGYEAKTIANHVPSFESLMVLTPSKLAKQSLRKLLYTGRTFITCLSFIFGEDHLSPPEMSYDDESSQYLLLDDKSRLMQMRFGVKEKQLTTVSFCMVARDDNQKFIQNIDSYSEFEEEE